METSNSKIQASDGALAKMQNKICKSATPGAHGVTRLTGTLYLDLETPAALKVDALGEALARSPQVDMPVTHQFTPGLYVREIFMPKGVMVISKIHKTEHPFVISKGRVSVWSEEEGVKHLAAPFTGITKPGTRRVLYIHEDCIWTTFHPTAETDIERIEEQIILKREPTHGLACDPAPAITSEIVRELIGS